MKGAKTKTLAKGQEQELSNISNYMLEDAVSLGKSSGAVKGLGKGKGNHGGPVLQTATLGLEKVMHEVGKSKRLTKKTLKKAESWKKDLSSHLSWMKTLILTPCRKPRPSSGEVPSC